jgi:hypothetical protein
MRGSPKIAYVTPYAVMPPNRGGRVRSHHIWRALATFADVTPVIIGDNPPAYIRNLLRSGQARFFPRRRMQKLTPAFQAEALASGSNLILPGLWEVLPFAELSSGIWAQLDDPESLVRHCLNPRRIERIVRFLRRLRPDLVYLCDSMSEASV